MMAVQVIVMMVKLKMKQVKPLQRPRLCLKTSVRSRNIWGPEMAFASGLSFPTPMEQA